MTRDLTYSQGFRKTLLKKGYLKQAAIRLGTDTHALTTFRPQSIVRFPFLSLVRTH